MKTEVTGSSKPSPLILLGMLLFSLILFGSFASAQSYNEAPQLAQLVQAGELPPVEERLPLEPMVIPVVDRIGEYGGNWNSGMVGIGEFGIAFRYILYDNLVRWNEDYSGAVPNIAKSWDVNEDASEFIFYLREGMRWSDGEPFTSADIVFWFEDILSNPELSPGGQPNWLRVEGQPAEISAPDDYTVVIRLAQPNSLFLQRLATSDSQQMTGIQAEYAKQFHINYNPNANDLATEAGFPSWAEHFQSRVMDASGASSARAQNPDLPTLTPWRLVERPTERVVFERNPYYWKVDPEGNQLPYLDRVVFEIVQSEEVLTLKTMSGEIDLILGNLTIEENKAVFFDNQERGSFRFFDVEVSFMNAGAISLNLNHKDPVKREIFNNRLFRQALSVAIDRQDVIDLVLIGQGEPWQLAPKRSDEALYNEELATQYTQHDPEQAMAWLDEAGYTVGPDGWRVGPDGQRISFILEAADHRSDYGDIAEIAAQHWRAIGLDAHARRMERTFYFTRHDAMEQDANIWVGSGGGTTGDAMLAPIYYFPFATGSSYAIAWANWFNPTFRSPAARFGNIHFPSLTQKCYLHSVAVNFATGLVGGPNHFSRP